MTNLISDVILLCVYFVTTNYQCLHVVQAYTLLAKAASGAYKVN